MGGPVGVLPELALTLRPATGADRLRAVGVLPLWEDGERFIIRAMLVVEGAAVPFRPVLGRDWATVVTWEGHVLRVRSADCGGDCFCAGEFRFP